MGEEKCKQKAFSEQDQKIFAQRLHSILRGADIGDQLNHHENEFSAKIANLVYIVL